MNERDPKERSMRLVRLAVGHFGAVASARVEFGPGFNVLYGPNELGKSTLAQAIRAVLLVPFSSSAHEPWIAWGTDDSPEVELVFTTGPQRFWRVRKTFGHSAALEESKDGDSFTNTTTGRRVDAEIRRLLNWGIPEPGGSGGPKGVPETFLTAVLLAPQSEPTRVFQKTLADDYDESGRQLLTGALQALATDPMFTRVLEQAQAKYDEAFTATGSKRTGRASPFKQISDQIKQDENRQRELHSQAQASDAVRDQLATLRTALLRRRDDFERARAALDERRKLWQTRCELDERLARARAELNRTLDLHRNVAEKESRERELQQTLDALTQQSAAAAQQLERADQRLAAAKEQFQRARSAEQAAARQLRQAELEKTLIELDVAGRDAQELAERAAAAKRQADSMVRLQTDRAALQSRIDDARQSLAAQAGVEQSARAELDRLRGLEVWLAWRDTSRELERAESARANAELLRKQAADKHTEAATLQAELAARRLPTPDRLLELHKLAESVRLADARLEVGLSVTVSPLKSFDLKVARDGEKAKKQKAGKEDVSLEAQSQIKLVVGETAEIEINGGKPEARERATALRTRWKQESQPVFEPAGVESLDELGAACRKATEQEQRIRELLRDAAAHQSQADSIGDLAPRIAEIARSVAELDHALADHDRSALAALAESKPPGRQELARRRKDLEEATDQSRKSSDDLRIQLAKDETRFADLDKSLAAAHDQHARSLDALAGNWQQALTQAETQLKSIQSQRDAIERELMALAQQGDAAVSQAGDALRAAELSREEAAVSHKSHCDRAASTAQSLAGCRGELTARREAAAHAEPARAQAAVAELERERTRLPTAPQPLDEPALKQEQQLVERLESEVREIEGLIKQEEGKLTQVGGDIVRERLVALSEAVNKKREQEAETELDYNAWKLLIETLRDVENTEAAHLGKAIVPTLARRFGELTGGRFGELELDPNLETGGINAAGQPRKLDLLSVGTQEQLSAVFRAILAEQLGSVLLLDDQLAQTDDDRMRWFRDFLRSCARKSQIIVLTCRPDDYLSPDEFPAANEVLRESDSGQVRATRLEQLVRRQ